MKLQNLFWLSDLNYRARATSHKPKNHTDIGEDVARVYRSMLDAGKTGSQPWKANEVVSVITMEAATELLGVTKDDLREEVEGWDTNDSRRAWYDLDKITHIAVFGHCRQMTLRDVIVDSKLSPAKVEIPTVVEDFVDAGAFFRTQLHENEEKNVGAKSTSVADKLLALYRAIKYGRKPRRESDITAMLGTKRGVTQKLWALYQVGELLVSGHDRLQQPKGRGKDAKIYDPMGHVPSNLDREVLVNSDTGILTKYLEAKEHRASASKKDRKAAQTSLEEAITAARVKLETYIAKHVSGKGPARVRSTGVKEWKNELTAVPPGTFGNELAQHCLDGELAEFIDRYDWLYTMTAVEVDKLGQAVEAEAEAEVRA